MKRKTLLRETKKANARWQILNKVFANFYSISDKTVEDAKNILKPHAAIIAAQYKHLVDTDPWKPDLRSGSPKCWHRAESACRYTKNL